MKKFNIEIELSDKEIEFLKNMEFNPIGGINEYSCESDDILQSLINKDLIIEDFSNGVIFLSRHTMKIIEQIKKQDKKLFVNDVALDYLKKMKEEVQQALDSKTIKSDK